MGTLTEYFAYLKSPPKKLNDTMSKFSYFTPSIKDKQNRNSLKLYKK
jgi:hypothetical protein